MKPQLILPLCLLGGILMADTPKAFFRMKIERTDPENQPIRTAVSVFPSDRFFPWMSVGKFGIGKVSGKIPFPKDLKDVLPWSEILEKDQFLAGETTPWIDITEDLSVQTGETARQILNRKTFCVTFQNPKLPTHIGRAPGPNPVRHGYKGDCGNLKAVSAILEFASAPDEKHIVKQLKISTDYSVIAVVMSGILDEKKNLKPLEQFTTLESLHDDLKREHDFLQKENPFQTTLKKCVSSSWVHHGYNFDFYDSKSEKLRLDTLRRMGFNYVNWYITPPRNPAPEGISFQFIEFPTGPEWLLKSPFHPVPKEKALAQIREVLETWMEEYHIDRNKEVLCRVGDEIKLIPEKLLYSEPECAERFRAFLKSKGVEVKGTEKPVLRDDIKTADDAQLYYYSCEFRHKITLEFWLQYMALMREAFGEVPVRFGMESCGISYDSWPDYQEMSEAHLMDYFIHEFCNKIWIPHHYILGKGAQFASAAKYGKEEAGGLMAPERVKTEHGNDLIGAVALSRGFRHAFFYMQFSPDDQSRAWKERSVARFNRRFVQLEEFILNSQSSMNGGTVAVGVSHASEVWRDNKNLTSTLTNNIARGVLAERHLTMTALDLCQMPYDYLTEPMMEKNLKNYTSLILPDPNLSAPARKAVAEWVRNGGHLITFAESASLDEFNQPHRLQEDLQCGLADKVIAPRGMHYGEYNPDLFDKAKAVGIVEQNGTKIKCVIAREDLAAEGTILAKWDNGSTAAAERKVGKGCWTHLGYLPGPSLARSASEVFQESMKHYWEQEKQADQCEFAPELLTLLPSLLKEETAARQISVNRPGVTASLFVHHKKGAVILADFGSKETKKVQVHLPGGRWTKCKTEDGLVLPIRENGKEQIVETDLGSTLVLFLTKEK